MTCTAFVLENKFLNEKCTWTWDVASACEVALAIESDLQGMSAKGALSRLRVHATGRRPLLGLLKCWTIAALEDRCGVERSKDDHFHQD